MMQKYKGYLAVVGGTLIQLSLGTLYSWGNITPYVTSYIRKHSQPATVEYGDTLWVAMLGLISEGIALLVSGFVVRRIGARLSTLIGCAIASGSVFVSAFTIRYSFYLFLITYGLMFGGGIGMAYSAPLSVAMSWFPSHRGAAGGFIVAGFGVGSFIFDYVQTAYVNPSNIQPVGSALLDTSQNIGDDKYFIDETVLSKVPSMFMLLGGCYMAMQIIGVALLFPKEKTEESEELQLMNSQSASQGEEVKPAQNADEAWSLCGLVRQKTFITLWLIFMFGNFISMTIMGIYKTYGESQVINDDEYLTSLGAFAAVFNALGRVSLGAFADKFSSKAAILAIYAVLTCMMGTLYLSHVFVDSAGEPLLFIWICVINFVVGGIFSVFPSAASRSFGEKHAGINYGMMFSGFVIATPAAGLVTTFLFRVVHYYGIFIICACSSLVAFILGLTLKARNIDGSLL